MDFTCGMDMLWSRIGAASSAVLLGVLAIFATGCPDDSNGDPGGAEDVETGVPTDGESSDDASDDDATGADTEAKGDSDGTDASDASGVETDTDSSSREIELPPLAVAETDGFTTSKDCAACHSNAEGSDAMRDSEGRPVGFDDLWRASMMANATRDPLWRAVVSAEVEETPGASDEIQNKCLRCHAPMAYTANQRRGDDRISLAVLHEDSDLSRLAIDGVSCTSCHQIEADNLGTPASFTGGFEMTEEKTAFGPFADVYAEPMENRNGFTPKRGDHMRDSGLCGSCHTLYTDPIDAEGESTTSERFAEQTPFLEWRNSRYSTEGEGGEPEESCQSCHEPTDDRDGESISTQIARSKYNSDYPLEDVPERSPYGRHLFVGGNTLIPAILRDHRETLKPNASDEAFDALIDRVRRQLENRTATVEIERAEQGGETLEIEVGIEVATGHKFPTGYPSRRAWLELAVVTESGETIFRSGGVDERGRIVDGDGTPLAFERVDGPIEPHHEIVDADDEVQIYQSVMADAAGETTWRLMRAASYRKDNRLLPHGWSSDHPEIDEMAPVGVDGDENFRGGGDRISYRVPVDGADGPLTIEVALHYQPLSHRYARELFEIDTPAVRDFEFYWNHADRRPETVDTARQSL